MATATRKTAAPKPLTPAKQEQRREQQAGLIRAGVLLAILLAFLVPRVPSPLFGVDWWASVQPSLTMLWLTMPPDPIDVPVLGLVPQRPLLQWLIWVLAAFLSFLALTLVMHLSALAAQRTRPLNAQRTYLRLLVPPDPPGKPGDTVPLLKALHGMGRPYNPMQPTPPPFMLCWTARPEMKVQAGVSVCGAPSLVSAVQKQLLGVREGTRAETLDDPLLLALQPGRVLCVAEVRAAAGSVLPIAIVGRAHTLLAVLLPALAPQAQVLTVSVRIALSPVVDRRWRLKVLAAEERAKAESDSEAQQALKAKANSPVADAGMWVLVVAESVEAGMTQIQTIGEVLAGTALGPQRLVLGPVQVLPAVVEPAPPLPRVRRWVGLGAGLALAGAAAGALVTLGLVAHHPLLWAIPALLLWLPLLVLAAHWRTATNAELPQRHKAVLLGLLPPRNPRVVPLWWPWLGHL